MQLDIHADWNLMTAALFAAAPTLAAAASGTRAQTPVRSWRAALASCAALLALASLTSACTPRASSGAMVEAPAQAYVQRSPESARAPADRAAEPGMALIRVSDMPRQGQIVYRMILDGGPFPFDKDGDVFGNRERLLPKHPRGYYREYTVAPAHARNRGAKRIVCGGAPRTPDVCYYTQDHYNSFRQIVN